MGSSRGVKEMADPQAEMPKKAVKAEKLQAKKAFVICQNDYFRVIKAGDDLSNVPQAFMENLKTEGVI